MSVKRAAIVGWGDVATVHREAIHAIEGVDLVGVVDTDPDRRAAATAELGGPAFATVTELVALAKKNPDKLNYASAGVGTISSLSMEYFKAKTGTKIVHVPYNGGPAAVLALAVGQLPSCALCL